MIETSTLTLAAEQASPAVAATLDAPEPVGVAGWRPGRRFIEIAVLAALLLHAVVLTIALVPINWSGRKPPPPPIPVTIVLEPPKPPAPPLPAEKPEPPPPPAPAVPYAESGPDQVTRPAAPTEKPPVAAAPPPAPEPAPANEPAPAPEPPPAPAQAPEPVPPVPMPPSQTASLPVAPPAAPATKPAPPQPPKPVSKPRMPTPKAPRVRGPTDSNPSGEEQTGDVYLNQMHALIDKRVRYPNVPPDQRRGHPALFRVILARGGGIADLWMKQSSGDELLDQVFEEAIRRAAPFPRPPFKYTGEAGGAIWITMLPPWM